MDVIVIGGGISGLTMALSLHQAGIPVRVYEQADDPKPLGVGINLQPNAVRELDELGLGAQLADVGNRTDELAFFNKFGQLIWREPRGLAAGYRWPQISIHRGNLQMVLLAAARERLSHLIPLGIGFFLGTATGTFAYVLFGLACLVVVLMLMLGLIVWAVRN